MSSRSRESSERRLHTKGLASRARQTSRVRHTARAEFLSEADNWYGVLDPKERKKIQDRLAQRARRKRLAEATSQEDGIVALNAPAATPHAEQALGVSDGETISRARRPSPAWDEDLEEIFADVNVLKGYFDFAQDCFLPPGFAEQVESDLTALAADITRRSARRSSQGSSPTSNGESEESMDRLLSALDDSTSKIFTRSSAASSKDQGALQPPALPCADEFFLTVPSIMIYAALYNNGACMDIDCKSMTTPHCSQRRLADADSGVPCDLRPTEMQMTTLHPAWIDCFPFAQFRDNMIRYTNGGTVDAAEFFRDLFTTHSFELVPGGKSWDAKTWTLFPGYADKWGFAFM